MLCLTVNSNNSSWIVRAITALVYRLLAPVAGAVKTMLSIISAEVLHSELLSSSLQGSSEAHRSPGSPELSTCKVVVERSLPAQEGHTVNTEYWCQEGVTESKQQEYWCQEGVKERKQQEYWCQEDVNEMKQQYWCQEGVNKMKQQSTDVKRVLMKWSSRVLMSRGC